MVTFKTRKAVADHLGFDPTKFNTQRAYVDVHKHYPDLPDVQFVTENHPLYRNEVHEGGDVVKITGEGAKSDQSLDTFSNAKLMARHRDQGPVKLVIRPDSGDPYTVLDGTYRVLEPRPVLAEGERESDGSRRLIRQYEWLFVREGSPASAVDVGELADRYLPADGGGYEPVGDDGDWRSAYGAVTAATDGRRGTPPRRRGSSQSQRNPAVKAVVRLRDGHMCRAPFCTGMPAALDDNEDGIVEVHHIHGVSHDVPEACITLCPNCHAWVTRGADRRARNRELDAVAKERHRLALTDGEL